jgi:phage anti-repressor protein
MNYIDYNKMDKEKLDIVNLINNSPLTKLSKGFHSTLIERIQKSFTDDEQQIFVASFYSYLNYNSKTDFVIDLDDVWKWCGFTRKSDAKRLLEKHFNLNIDYQIVLRQLAENLQGGRPKETILMTVNTFKKFCLKANTKRADEIHDYYIKLEELLQNTLQEQLQHQQQVLQEQEERIKLLQHKPHTFGFSCWRSGYVYLINDVSKPGHYKIGMATDTTKRVRNLNTASSERSLQLYYDIETYDAELCERTIQNVLQPFNIRGRREWFFFEDDTQLKYCIHIMNRVKEFLDNFNFTTSDDFCNYIEHNKTSLTLPSQTLTKKTLDTINETNVYKLTGQQMSNKTGQYKGACFSEEKQKWKSELKRDYVNHFLGYYDTELDAAKAYNDYAVFVNERYNTNYELNDIRDYMTTPRDIPNLSKQLQLENKTSRYTGVSYDQKREYFCVCIKYKRKTYHLGHNKDQIECAKLYNQQALYLNNHYGTKYTLNEIENYTTQENNYISFDDKPKQKEKGTSRFYGVTFDKNKQKYRSYVVNNKRQIHIGFFDDEIEAATAYNVYITDLNKTSRRKYKINVL